MPEKVDSATILIKMSNQKSNKRTLDAMQVLGFHVSKKFNDLELKGKNDYYILECKSFVLWGGVGGNHTLGWVWHFSPKQKMPVYLLEDLWFT